MALPPLPPDLAFPRLSVGVDDFDFAFEAKRAALGPHIVKRWAWDEAFQRQLHACRYCEKPFFEIRRHAHCLTEADGMRLPARLEYLHWNPVGSLYLRHGFTEIGRSEIHCFMEHP